MLKILVLRGCGWRRPHKSFFENDLVGGIFSIHVLPLFIFECAPLTADAIYSLETNTEKLLFVHTIPLPRRAVVNII